MTEQRKWSGRTRGGDFGQRFLIDLLGRISPRGAYLLLDMALPFYMPFSGKLFRSSFNYLRKRLHFNSLSSFFNAYSIHRQFGRMMFDRFRLFSGNDAGFEVEIEGNERFIEALESGTGCVVAGAHVGNMEMAGYMLGLRDKPINTIVFGGESKSMQSNREAAFKSHGINMISVSDDMSHLFSAKAALDRGEIVSMPCDRMLGSAKHSVKNFLGAQASFPIGAFRLAAALDKPMLSLFCMKDSVTKYHVYVVPVQVDRTGKNTREITDELLGKYVGILEDMVRKYPLQWFNFYEFWD